MSQSLPTPAPGSVGAPTSAGGSATARRRLTRFLVALVVVLGVAGLTPLVTAVPASAATTADVATVLDPSNGFPTWYQDASGTRLAPCLDAADTNCVVLADAGFDPAKALSFPANFPSEFFYSVVDSGRLDTKGCSGTKPGRFSVRMALEGSFVNGTPVPGTQMTFGRVRVIATGGLCKSSTYQVTYPFGQLSFTTDSSGALARNQGTTDVGCVPVAPATCDWRVALGSPAVKSFLRWDPNVAPAAPAGYLGDAVTAHRITGATFTAPGETAPANYVRLTGPSLSNPLTTNLFTVSGKLAGPLTASPGGVDFGGQAAASVSSTKRVTVTNLAQGAITPGAATLGGANAADFRVVADGCAGTSLARDASCTVDVAFAPSAAGVRTASLTIPHSGVRSPFSVALTGTGTAADAASKAELSSTTLGFGDQRIGVRSALRTVDVKSSGTSPLAVSQVTLTGADPGEFAVLNDTCTGNPVAVGSSCAVSVAFDPTKVQDSTASLRISSDDPASPTSVALTGHGYGGVAASSRTTSADDGFPDWYQDERGVRLSQCIDPTDPNCVVLPGGTYAGTPPLHFADNFPDEFFYSVVDSDQLTTPGCNGSAPGRAMIRMAVEGAFGQGQPLAGDQMTFGRIRINATSGLCPGETYTFVHPYGTDQFTADADGSIKRSPGTDDVGCLGASPTAPCDFGLAVKSRVFGSFLRWDPSVGPKAPAGYLGDGATLHRIVGAPYTAPGESAPANSFRIYRGSTLIAQTNLFTVMGKMAGPLVVSPANPDFGSVDGGQSTDRTVTLENQGIDPLTVNGTVVAGASSADYSVPTADDQCSGQVLDPKSTCTMRVRFTPGGVGDRRATLTVDHTGGNSPTAAVLSGTGLSAAGTPALSADVSSLDFADLHVGRTSVAQTVTVSNKGGSAPLTVTGTDLTGADAVDFAVVANGCTVDVAPGDTCALKVAYSPVDAGAHRGTLTVHADAASTPAVTVALSGTGFAGSSAVSPGVRPDDGFPTWYQDGNGVRLAPCIDPSDTRCVVLGGAGFDPANPVSFPDNYPPEFFYALADSEVMQTPGCEGSAPGTAMLRLALEGTFAGDGAQAGQQIVFGRVRFNATSGLCPGQTYTLTTPYGDLPVTANADGAVARTVGTTDIGCGAAPCSFGAALASPVLDGFVRWAPGVGAAAPAGYLGDAVSYHQIVGATHTVGGEPANYVELSDASGASVVKSSKFLVSGKLAGGLAADAVAFPDQQVGATSATRTVTFTNIGSSPVSVADIALGGADPAAFSVAGGTCTTGPVAADGSCTVTVRFAPTQVRAYSAVVRARDAGGNALGSAEVTGHGIDAGIARATVGPTGLQFAGQRVGSTSAAASVTVTNTGTAPLVVGAPELSGAAAGDYTTTSGAGCASVAPGASCVVAVRFTPTALGTRTASLSVPSNDPVGPRTVGLTGTGTGSQITLKSASLDLGKTKVGKPVTKSVTLSNSGTAPLTIGAVKVDDPTAFSVSLGTCNVAVAAGRTCNIAVTYLAPGPAGSRTSVVRFTSDAVNNPTLSVTGSST
jgi:hypothetical protein